MKLYALLSLSLIFNLHALVPLEIHQAEILNFFPVERAASPLLIDKQSYLEDSPLGIGAKSFWKIAGGKGENVRIIDIETGMNDQHEDLPNLFYSLIPKDSDHGTAVMGIMGGTGNEYGVTGIAHEAEFGFLGFIEGDGDISDQYTREIVKRIEKATELLEVGDILVIEQQATGPGGDYILVEYWDPIFNALKKATDKGIHCIEAAGNGGDNLDDPVYNEVFDRKKRDSGCVVVGAGSLPNKNVMSFSNYGKIVDAFGYGEKVTGTGYGDAFSALFSNDRDYTNRFSGTSSATPIVAGAVALISSIAKEQGVEISPIQMREALRVTGVPSVKSKKNIGNFPDLKGLASHFNLQVVF